MTQGRMDALALTIRIQLIDNLLFSHVEPLTLVVGSFQIHVSFLVKHWVKPDSYM